MSVEGAGSSLASQTIPFASSLPLGATVNRSGSFFEDFLLLLDLLLQPALFVPFCFSHLVSCPLCGSPRFYLPFGPLVLFLFSLFLSPMSPPIWIEGGQCPG